MPATLGRYELIAEIGRGGMADVKLGLQRGPGGFEKLVALKVLHEELQSDKQVVAMLLDEAKWSALIKHPNVVEVYEHGEADGKSFIAMEYLEGEPLLAVLDKGFTGQKRLDPLSMARIIADTAEGLDAAHTLKTRDGKPLNLVHHDISLGNIFVLYGGQVKLLDFGVAKAVRSAAAKRTSQEKMFGKLAYMAPEKLDERPGDRRSDLWSLGCVLWEALTYKRLFKGANDIELIREVRYVNVPAPSTVNPDVPPELDPIVLRALQRDPFRRYQTAKELAVALEQVLTAKAYPAKNFQIAAYMMQSFADHIAARERLLREVSGTSRASQEVIEAAFGDSALRRESSLPVLDHSLDNLFDPANQVVLPEGSTGADMALAIPNAPPPPSAAVSVPFEDDDGGPANAPHEEDPSGDDPGIGWRRLIPYAIGGAIALVLIVVIAKSCGGGRHDATQPVAKAADPIAIDAAAVATPVAIDAGAIAVAIDAADEIEMPADAVPDKPVDNPDHPKPTKSAQQLYAEGLAAWNKKDLDKAYALFTEGRRASGRYPNNWYGIGLVHEKRGRKKEAKVAYERYLTLAPNAPNAAKLRQHIKKNL